MTYNSMGELIADLRKQQNMTQRDLAEKLNVTDKAVSKWERDITCPDIHTIPKLADVLNISSEELLTYQRSASLAVSSEADDRLSLGERVRQMSMLALKAVGLAMGASVLVLSIMDSIAPQSAITLLAIGLTCLGIAQLPKQP